MVYTQCTRYVLLKYQILLKSTKMALPKMNQVLCVCVVFGFEGTEKWFC